MFLELCKIGINTLKNKRIYLKIVLLKNRPDCSDFKTANYKFVTSLYVYKRF